MSLWKGKQKTSNPPPPPNNDASSSSASASKPPKPSISTIQTHNSNNGSNRYSAVATPQSVEIIFQTSPAQGESPTRARSPFRFDGYTPLPLVELKSNTESSPRQLPESTTTTDLRSEIYGGDGDGSDAKSSVMMAVFNFTNSIIGAGIMGLPYAMNKAGFGMGILLLFLLTFIVDWSVILLVQNGKMSSTNTYQDMVRKTFGFKGYLLITVFQFLFAYGGMAAYMVIIADNMPKVMRQIFGASSILSNRSFLLTNLTAGVMLPLSCYRNITKLASTSLVSLVAVLLLIIVVMIEAPLHAVPQAEGTFDFIHADVFQAIGVIAFAFVCHHNSFIIYGSLKRPSLNRFSAVTHWSTGISLAASLCMAIPGYLSFSSSTQANILKNLPPENGVINFARFCFAFTMFLTYPMECFVAREVIELFFFPGQGYNAIRHYGITTALVIVTYIIALSTCDLGFILELTGGFSATLLAFILPPACYIKLASGKMFDQKKWLSWLVIVFGFFTMILSTFFTIKGAMSSSTGDHQCEL